MVVSFLMSCLLMSSPTSAPTTGPATTTPTTSVQVTNPVFDTSTEGRQLAQKIFDAAGGPSWNTVKRIRFTFNVERDSKLALSVKHDWNVTTGDASVTIGDKTTITNVYSNAPRDDDAEQAFARWTNDSYWLLKPIKLIDSGVIHSQPIPISRDIPPSLVRLTIRFENVGLTPGDQYDLTVNTENHQVVGWTYRPNPEKAVSYSWEDHLDFNGLILATNHKSEDGKIRIFFTDVEVTR